MREVLPHRDAHVRALLVISAGFLISNCAEKTAFADDSSVATLATPTPPHHFGDKGDVVLPVLGVGFGSSGDSEYTAASFGITHYSYFSQSEGPRVTGTTYMLTPSADVFIGKHVSLGGVLRVDYYVNTFSDTIPDDRQLTLGFTARIGYAFPVSEHVSIWPRLALGMNAYDSIGSTSQSVQTPFELVAAADVQIVYTIDRRFYVAVAPTLSVTGFPRNGAYPSAVGATLASSFSAGFVL